jgi:ABC-type dipeptide/oligopeptide/nickel transport system permease subunit
MIRILRERTRRLLSGRGMRKLLRDRMAVVGLVVISLYGALALAVGAFGLITEAETVERVGPNTLPGLGVREDADRRYEHLLFWLETAQTWAERMQKLRDAGEARLREGLREFHIAELRPVTEDPDALMALVEERFELLDELEEHEDLGSSPQALALLEHLEESARGLYAWPEGLHGARYRLRLLLGTDRQGRSILLRGLYSIKVAIQIGVVSALFAVAIGTLLGGLAGYLGGKVDHVVVWLYSTFSSIPWIVLLMVLAAAFVGGPYEGTLIPVYTAFCISFWIAPCRVIRGEVMKLKELEYVQAASAAGFGRARILLRHILPNTAHLMFINFSLLFIGAIKAEVILSFLNLGVKGEPSWGVMINHARQEVLNGFFWQIGTATALMFILVLAFNVLSDALQDAFDPKHIG